MEFAGKIMMFYLALPVLSAILEMISSLLQM
ncbi:MAG: SpoIIIAC/SpoIIIAD family protein [Anaerovoracaceae bacterium]